MKMTVRICCLIEVEVDAADVDQAKQNASEIFRNRTIDGIVNQGVLDTSDFTVVDGKITKTRVVD